MKVEGTFGRRIPYQCIQRKEKQPIDCPRRSINSSLQVDPHNMDCWRLLIPVGCDVFKDQAEFSIVAWCEWRNADRFSIDVGVVGANESKRRRFKLGLL